MNQLFLEQAARFRASREDGRPRLVSPPGLWLICVGLVAALSAAVLFLATGEYARKETVSGVLETEDALKRVYAPRAGIVSEIRAKPGMTVSAGTVLLRFSIASGVDSRENAKVLAGFEAQLAALDTQITQLTIQRDSELARLVSEVTALKQLNLQHTTVTSLQQEKVRELEQTQDAARPLFEAGKLSRIEWGRFRDGVLSAQQQLAGLLAEAAAHQEQLIQADLESAQSTSRFNRQFAVLEQQATDLKQRRHRLMAEAHFSVDAPVDGVVSALLVQVGQQVSINQSVVTVLPAGTRLYARLQIPSRAAGFIEPGQSVNLLYDAFPYQQFGSFPATLTNISEHVILPGEDAGMRSTEPFFLATAGLVDQSVLAYGDRIPLKSGMSLKADVVLEKRSLMAWLLEPLLIMRGRAG